MIKLAIFFTIVMLSGCSFRGQSDSYTNEQSDSYEYAIEWGEVPVEDQEFELAISIQNLSIHDNPDIIPGVYFTDNVITAFAGGGAYPRLYELADGTVLLGFDMGRAGSTTAVMVTTSKDMVNWTTPVLVAGYNDLYAANVTFIQLENGDILAFHRANQSLANEPRQPHYYSSIRASISRDGANSWEPHSIVVEEVGIGGVYEPHPIWINGQVAVFYANDSRNVVNRHEEQNIEFRLWDGESWSETFIASNGIETQSRDGMAVLDRTLDGGYVMVIEATNVPGHPFVVQMTKSPDGMDWSMPMRNIFVPQLRGARAAAPYVVTLPDGRFAVSFQTDAGRPEAGDRRAHMNVMFSLDTKGEVWTDPFVPFLVPDDGVAVWTSLFLRGDRLYTAAGSNHPHGGIFLREALLTPHTPVGQNVISNGMFIHGNTSNWYFHMNDLYFYYEFPPIRMLNRHGNRYISFTNNTNSDIQLNQQIPGVARGEYSFSIRAFGGAHVAIVITQGSEKIEFSFNTREDDFAKIEVSGINLQDGVAHISIAMVGGTGRYLSLDDIALVKN